MVLEIIKYSNRKFYIRTNLIDRKAGYITLPEILCLLRGNKNLEIKVIKKSTGENVTKNVLNSLLSRANITETEIYSLLRKEFQYQPESKIDFLQGIIPCKIGVEL